MNKNEIGKWLSRSSFFKSMKNKASEYLGSPEKLTNLVNKVMNKANKTPKEALRAVTDNLRILCRMVRAYAQREYTDAPWLSMILVVAAILYFLMPTDCIPDFIFMMGFIDDASVIVWTADAVRKDIDKFLNWEKKRKIKPPQPLEPKQQIINSIVNHKSGEQSKKREHRADRSSSSHAQGRPCRARFHPHR